MSTTISESEIEAAALEILSDLRYKILYGPDIAPDGINPQRKSYSDLVERLRDAIDSSTTRYHSYSGREPAIFLDVE